MERCLPILGVTAMSIQGNVRTTQLVRAREVIAAILRAYRPWGVPTSYPDIAQLLRGRRNTHPTVMDAVMRWSLHQKRVDAAIRIVREAKLPREIERNLHALRIEMTPAAIVREDRRDKCVAAKRARSTGSVG